MPKLIAHDLTKEDFLAKKEESNYREEPPAEKSPFSFIARLIYRNPVPFLLFMPIFCSFLIGFGFSSAEVEDSVSELWARKDSEYYHDLEYRDKVSSTGGGNSGALAIAKPRKGSNVINTDFLQEIEARMNETENVKVTHKGEVYTFDDICYNPLGEYVYPCYRLTTLDCFEQGGYSFDGVAAAAWRELFVGAALDTAVASVETDAINLATATSLCEATCNTTKLDWETDSVCLSCYNGFLNDNHTAQFNTIYYVAVKSSVVGDATVSNAVADAAMVIALNSTVHQGIITYKYTVIITALASSASCSGSCDVTADDWEDDATCSACYTAVYGAMTQTQKDTTYYQAMQALTGISNQAIVDAVVESIVEDLVYAAAAEAVVNEAVATGFCASDSGDRGYCNMTSAYWDTNTECMRCFEGFLNGTMDEQADYIYYTAIRGSFDEGVNTGIETFEYTVTITALATAACPSACDLTDASWASDTTCATCYLSVYNSYSDAQRSAVYYQAMSANFGLTAAAADAYATSYVRSQAYGSTTAPYSLTDAFIDAYVEAAATATLESLVAGKTPYTFQIYSDPMGQPRTSTDNTDSVLLAAVSETCYNWDEGLVLPEAYHIMTLGGTNPDTEDADTSNPYTRVKATQIIYYFLHQDNIKVRVASNDRPAGAITISTQDAEEILYKFKKKFEKTFSQGWDNDGSGDVQFTAFTDDTGVVGTFGRTLLQFTVESLPLSLLSYLVTAVVCSLLLGNLNDYVRSRMALGMFGCVAAVIAFTGALGLTCLFKIKLNIVQTWTLPFLMVGLGMDDMFILALAADVFFSKEENKRNGRHNIKSAEDIFVEAYEHVAIPVSLTSVVNAAMFSIMTISDIPAVQLTAVTAVISVILLYLTMMTCFAAAIVLDFKRQLGNYNDIMCCFENIRHAVARVQPPQTNKQLEEEKEQEEEPQTLPNLKHLLWDKGYEPMIRSIWGRVVILTLALVVFVLACVGISMMEVGLGLEEFFPNDSMGYTFSLLRSEYFPAWPAQMNWGEVKYHKADVQLQMMEQFEDVTGTRRITSIDTDVLWTASLAEWSMPEDYDTGYCDSGNALTSGYCGPNLDSTCTGSWVVNTRNLKLSSEGGVCRTGADLSSVDSSLDSTLEYCPVLDLSEANYAKCISLYKNWTNLYSVLNPGLKMSDDDITPTTPIKFSQASGSTMFTYNLFTTDDYVKMIEDARKGCDESNGPHCWVSGIAFEYWEQYITIETWLLEISGYGLIIALFVSSLFFYIGFSTLGSKEKKADNKICGTFDKDDVQLSCVCGMIVTLNSALSLFVVVGMSSLSGVNMAGLSAMACLMSAGFSVEFSVHVVHRFVESDPSKSPVDRVCMAVEALFMPTALGFISSAVGILTLLFSSFSFVLVYFFTPLFIMLIVTFYFGIFMLPAILSFVDLDIFKIYGKEGEGELQKAVEVKTVLGTKNTPTSEMGQMDGDTREVEL